MNLAVEPLPNDVTLPHALILATRAERDAEQLEKQTLIDQNDRLRHIIAQLQRMQFGKRSEKLDPDQLNLALEDLEQAGPESEAEAEKANPALTVTGRCTPGSRHSGRISWKSDPFKNLEVCAKIETRDEQRVWGQDRMFRRRPPTSSGW